MLGIAGNGFVLSGKSRCGPKPPRWGFRAAHDRRLSAGPRQGSKTLDPGKKTLHFSVIFHFRKVYCGNPENQDLLLIFGIAMI